MNDAATPPTAGMPLDGAVDEFDGIDPHVYANRWKTLIVLCGSLLIVIIGNTVLNVALPRLQATPEQGGIGATNTEIQWIVDGYGLVFAGLLFTAAALGDRFGRKGALQGGLIVFAIGSLIGAFGDSSTTLILGRGVMGIGAAFVMPSTLSILTNVFPRREQAKAIAIWAGISGGGAAIGPLASGLLLEHYWWGSVFLVNIPIIAAVFIGGLILVPRSADETHTPLDPVGALLSIVGLSALVYAIIEGPHHGWISVESLVWFLGAALFIGLFIWWEQRFDHPMLDLDLFRIRRFAVSSAGITLVFFAMFGLMFMLTQYLQGVLDYSPLGAAVRLLPISFVMIAVAPNTPKLVARYGANVVAAGGLAMIAASMIGTGIFDLGTPYIQVVLTMMVLAAGMALTMTPMTTQLMASVPRNRAGMGSATNDTTRELGGALGVAILGSLVTSQYGSSIASALEGAPAEAAAIAKGSLGGALSEVAKGELPLSVIDAAKHAFVDGFSVAAFVAAGVVAASAIAVWKLLPSDKNAAAVTGEAGDGAGPDVDLDGVLDDIDTPVPSLSAGD